MLIDVFCDANPYFNGYKVERVLAEMLDEVEDGELTLHITFDDDLDGDRGGTIYNREVEWLRRYGNVEVHDAEIFLAPSACTSKRDLLETLCHELVHVKQYVTGTLREDYTKLCWVWCDRPCTYIHVPFQEATTESPWELEAEALGLLLCEDYFAS